MKQQSQNTLNTRLNMNFSECTDVRICKYCNRKGNMADLRHVYVSSRQSFVTKYRPIFVLFPTLQHNLQQVPVAFEKMWILKHTRAIIKPVPVCTKTTAKTHCRK